MKHFRFSGYNTYTERIYNLLKMYIELFYIYLFIFYNKRRQ